MSFYENVVCPVCNREFMEEDDIVTCPECGTPHHRECYNLIGHCVNKGLHKANYSFYDEHKKEIEEENKTESESAKVYYSPKSEDNDESETKNPFIITDTDTVFDKDNDTISGESVGDVAATVRINASKFVNKFKKMEATNKKTSWNWSAFIFGSFYLLYRKMYKVGIAFLAIAVSIMFAGSALLLKLAPNFISTYVSILNEASSSSNSMFVSPSNEQMMSIMNTPDAKNALICSYIMIGAFVVLHLIIGLFADNFYKKTVVSIIKKVREQLDNGASFSQSTIIMSSDMNMSQEQMKKIYLARKGGTSFMAPTLALFLLSWLI